MVFDDFCGGPLWDNNLTIDTQDPDFTICFQHSVLLWAPIVFLWLFCPFLIYKLRHSTKPSLPWTWLLILKLVFAIILIPVTAMIFFYGVYLQVGGYSPPLVELVSPAVLFASMVLIAILIGLCQKHGLVTSGVIWVSFLLFAICGLFEFRSRIISRNGESNQFTGDNSDLFRFVCYIIYYLLILMEMFLFCFADEEDPSVDIGKTYPCPEFKSSYLNQITFSYFTKTAYNGWRRPLRRADLWDLNDHEGSRVLVKEWESRWDPKITDYKRKKEAALQKAKGGMTAFKSYGSMSDGEKDPLIETKEEADKKLKDSIPPQPSVIWTIFLCYRGTIITSAVFKLVSDVMQFLNPKILDAIITFVQTPSQPQWQGFVFAVGLLVSNVVYNILQSQYFAGMFRTAMCIRSILVSALFTKSLRLSNSARKQSTVGEIVNLMSVDIQRFMDVASFINMLWSSPLQIILALYFLWMQLGPSVIAGLVVLLLLIPLNGVLTSSQKKYQVEQMKAKDARIKLVNEMLNSMKVLKLYAWEPSFEEQIERIRKRELAAIRKVAFFRAGFMFIFYCAPFFVSAATFAAFVISDPINHILTAQNAFVSLSLFNILRFPMNMLPNLITYMVQASVSNTRMKNFLTADELVPDTVTRLPKDGTSPIEIDEGTFAWEKDGTPTLYDINFKIPEKGLVAVVGQVGTGKSSLISAILGEMDKDKGSVKLKGSVAYVPQQAWIQNATLRNNISFSQQYKADFYDKVIDSCALKPDFDILPGGDVTEIGEKGINLSGGQKQRVSLARAVYQQSDVYLLDDPLSAVDSHVGKHIFDNVIGKDGLLKNKTRVLVTHGLGYLKDVDKIFVMKNGRISESGTYDELVAAKGAFSEVLNSYNQDKANKEPEPELPKDPEEIKRLKRMKSEAYRRELSVKGVDASRAFRKYKSTAPGIMKPMSMSQVGRKSSQGSSVASHPSRSSSMNLNRSLMRLMSGQEMTEDDEGDYFEDEIAEEDEKQAGEVAGTRLIEAEEEASGRVKLGVYWIYIKALGYIQCLLILIAYCASNGFTVGSNLWLSAWSSDPVPQQPSEVEDVPPIGFTTSPITPQPKGMPVAERLGGYVGLGLAQGVSVLAASLMMSWFTVRASTMLHRALLHNILRSPMSFFDVTPLGRIVNRCGKDVDTLDNNLPMTIPSFVNMAISVIANIIVIIVATPIFAVVVIPLTIIYLLLQRVYVASSRQLKRMESTSRSPIYTHFQETITGASSIRAYQVEYRFISESEQKVDYNNMAYYPNAVVSARWISVLLVLLGNFIAFFAALFAVLSRNTLAGGLAGLAVSNAMSITMILMFAVRMSSDLETNIVSVERIKEYSETPTEAEWEHDDKPPPEWPDDGKVHFEDYAVRYRPGLDLVLKDITCNIDGGEKIGIVGRTGAGKSSLTLALFRLIEAAMGKIVIDGIDIASLGLHDLRRKLTIIPQDPVLFTGSLRLNLDPFSDSSDIELWQALEHSHLKEFVSGLPDKLEHYVAEGGENLSVGQRQLVCLARALLRRTKVLVLDEATAAVDLETDDLIQETIRQEFKECTILTIAHRLNTIMDSSRVIVLDKGMIAEFDTPQALLDNKKTIFYSMAKNAGLVS